MWPGLRLWGQVSLLFEAQAVVYAPCPDPSNCLHSNIGASSSTHTTFQPWQAAALLVPSTLQHPQRSCQAWQALMALLLL